MRSLSGFLVVTIILAAGCGVAEESQTSAQTSLARAGLDPAFQTELETVRAATEKYRDVKVAEAEGYLRDPFDHCITARDEGFPRQLGEMGLHYFRPDLLGITATEPRVDGEGTHTDFRQPAVLIYEPQADGSLELVAIENLVFEKSWKATGATEAPSYYGNEYYHMVDNPRTEADEAHLFQPHHELHMWLYRDNPNGLFAQFNPNVTCEHHGAHAAASKG